MRVYYVYACLCIVTAKIYIGWAVNPKKRWAVHCASKDGTHFHNAIQKYGKEYFERYIIAWAVSEKEIKQKEKDFIIRFNTFIDGYNQTRGGDGISGWTHSKTTKKKLSEAKKKENRNQSGKNNPMFGRANPSIVGNKNPMRKSEITAKVSKIGRASCRERV